jgi:hypothetical protein
MTLDAISEHVRTRLVDLKVSALDAVDGSSTGT